MTDGRERFLVNFNPLKPGLLQKSAGVLPVFRKVKLKDHAVVMYISGKILAKLVCVYMKCV